MKRDIVDSWLKDNGLNSAYFTRIALEQARALKAAHLLLEQHTGLLSAEQTAVLQSFRAANAHVRTRDRVTRRQCLDVLNIQAKINRAKYRQSRHSG